ncbi:MAG: MFS transporter [Terracidiphilus sp.]|jgi:ACS family hexuronate transporter-like MFS transporter
MNHRRLPSARIWRICILLFLATAIVYLDRQVLALTAPKIIETFHLSKEQFGQIIGAFRYSYGFVQIVGGFLVDAYGPRIVFPMASGLWSTVGVLTGLATTVGMLTGLRFLLGAGEAFIWPCSLKVTNTMIEPKDRPLANGIFNSGAALGALVAPVIITVIAVHWSWRAAFVVTGSMSALWLLGWLWVTRPEAQALKGVPFPARNVVKVVVTLITMPDFWILAVASLVANGVNYYLADWIPLYLVTARGFSFTHGNALSITVYAGSFTGNLIVGLFVRVLVKRGWSTNTAKQWALFAACLLMCMAAPAGLTPNRYLAVLCLSLTAVGVGSFLVIYLTLVQDLVPEYVGVSSGLLGGLSNIAYGLVSRQIGALADLHHENLIFLLIAVLPWFAFFPIFVRSRFAHD